MDTETWRLISTLALCIGTLALCIGYVTSLYFMQGRIDALREMLHLHHGLIRILIGKVNGGMSVEEEAREIAKEHGIQREHSNEVKH